MHGWGWTIHSEPSFIHYIFRTKHCFYWPGFDKMYYLESLISNLLTEKLCFSNGLLDPWSSGGVISSVSKSAIAVVIPEAAHHLDLRASNPLDPTSVTVARQYYRQVIWDWIRSHKSSHWSGEFILINITLWIEMWKWWLCCYLMICLVLPSLHPNNNNCWLFYFFRSTQGRLVSSYKLEVFVIILLITFNAIRLTDVMLRF